jgi:hypothetical protein
VSIIGKIIGIAVLLVVLLVVLAVSAYASDYAVDATVQETKCSLKPPMVAVDAGLFGTRDVEVTADQCGILRKDNYVVYHIRSKHTTIYEAKGGRCLYDSETGLYCGAAGTFPLALG